jgi:EAL domain-containing protein (putative c-di-GMP-specific phosphodiesterase class I)
MIKVDRSFVSQLEHSDRSEGIVNAIIQMAQTLQVQVVAEGVENEGQLNLLLRRGCDLFQGFYLARPMHAYEVSAALGNPGSILVDHPHFSQTRVAVSKRVRRAKTLQFPSLAATGTT